MNQTVIKKRACHLCEAICGLDIHIQNGKITAIKGDKDDPLSQGHICPKAVALQDIHNDPDRLRQPVQRTTDGWQPLDWDTAFDRVVEKLLQAREQHGANAIGVYQGNPSVHNYGCLTHPSQFLGPLKTRNRFSATSVDQLPHQLVAYWLFGHQLLLPIPDIDRCDYFLMLGANPMASNGSIMTVPNFPKRLKALQQRGGKLVVLDPRRTETADKADQHYFIRPGSDAALLAALVHIILRDQRVNTGRLQPILDGLEDLHSLFADFSPEQVSGFTGIEEAEIESIAEAFCSAGNAVCYGRMGCSTQEYGALCQWLTQLINILTGNMDEPGGMMFTAPAVDMIGGAGMGRPGSFDRYRSRVSGKPEFSGELPASCMAEEILAEGEGQIRALVTIAGNPVLSTPAGNQLDEALPTLDFMVSIDPYINETTRHADIILPPSSPLEHDHYDLIFHHFAVRNTAKYSAAVFEKPADEKHDWEIFSELGERVCKALGQEQRPLPAPHEIVDLGLQMGRYDLDLEKLQQQPAGVDLGPLQPCLPDRLQTPNQRIHCVPDAMPAELSRLKAALQQTDNPPFQLIGRRHVRSNNSWMHQYQRLIKGADRCTLLIHPDDARDCNLGEGDRALVKSQAGEITIAVQISDSMMPGVVSVPHGYGHSADGMQINIAKANAGVSVNDLVPADFVDALSGNAAVNGVPVNIQRFSC